MSKFLLFQKVGQGSQVKSIWSLLSLVKRLSNLARISARNFHIFLCFLAKLESQISMEKNRSLAGNCISISGDAAELGGVVQTLFGEQGIEDVG